ncbi:MAG: hypothetical protein QW625_00315 [Candidatus Nanoarchaeia archaeon]
MATEKYVYIILAATFIVILASAIFDGTRIINGAVTTEKNFCTGFIKNKDAATKVFVQLSQKYPCEFYTLTPRCPDCKSEYLICCDLTRERCGDIVCSPGTTCCNPLMGICTKPNELCAM